MWESQKYHIRRFSETPLSVLIVGCGVLTGCRIRDIRSLSSWRPASADNRSAASSSPGVGLKQEQRGREDTAMCVKHQWWSRLMAAVLGGLVGVTAVAADEQFLPMLGYREGAVRVLGIPRANGYIAYLTLLNERDGGINGVKLVWEECETVYDNTRGVECYERLKGK